MNRWRRSCSPYICKSWCWALTRAYHQRIYSILLYEPRPTGCSSWSWWRWPCNVWGWRLVGAQGDEVELSEARKKIHGLKILSNQQWKRIVVNFKHRSPFGVVNSLSAHKKWFRSTSLAAEACIHLPMPSLTSALAPQHLPCPSMNNKI